MRYTFLFVVRIQTKGTSHACTPSFPRTHSHAFTFALLLLYKMRRKFDPHTLVPVTEKNSHSLCHALYACGLAWHGKLSIAKNERFFQGKKAATEERRGERNQPTT